MYWKIYANLWLIATLMISITKAGQSFNQPKFCSSATWYSNGITFINGSSNTSGLASIFINTNDTVYVIDTAVKCIQVWPEGSLTPVKNISSNLNDSNSLFFTMNGDLYVENSAVYNRIEKWTSNATIYVIAMYIDGTCYNLFLDIQENIYCSMGDDHRVIQKLANDNPNTTTIIAGNGTAGSTSTMLNNPRGIFVDIELNLYVADCFNDRIQFFPSGQLNATTVAGNNTSGTITLSCPSAVVLDADGYMFIVDTGNDRIVASGFNGFRCLFGCTGGSGSASNQLNDPRRITFDSYGNLFVVDKGNYRIQKILLASNSCGPSYNQPKFCPSATWNPNATTFANISIISLRPWGLFVDVNNTVYVAAKNINKILVWQEGNMTLSRTISGNFSEPYSVFASLNGDIYVDDGRHGEQVDMWTLNSTSSVAVMNVSGTCYSLFVDLHDNLYCSDGDYHRIVKRLPSNSSSTTSIVAGNGTSGSTSTLLTNPRGIFVDHNSNLYVADCGNNRIQFFVFGQLNATTVVVQGSAGTITLNCPTGIILDGDEYLFITDYSYNRIVRSEPNGFRCIAGCTGVNGSAPDQLYYPRGLSFDSYGNIFVVDGYNNRVQKFLLDTNTCGESTTIEIQSTSLSTLTMETSFTSTSHRTVSQPVNIFVPSICPNPATIGVYCNISSAPCDTNRPCQNSGTCYNNDTLKEGYICLCLLGFNGTQCQFDNRPCKATTCWNNGICNETYSMKFSCLCSPGWKGDHCQTQINSCAHVSCLNNGICRSSFLNYTCECLGDSYSGRHCEVTANQILVYKTLSKSFAYIAIIVMISAAMFIVIMDLLKYCFGINPAPNQFKRIPKKRKPPVIIRFRYVHAPSSPKTTETIDETKI